MWRKEIDVFYSFTLMDLSLRQHETTRNTTLVYQPIPSSFHSDLGLKV